MSYENAVWTVLTAAMAVLALGTLVCLIRAIIGPTPGNRLIAVNMTGTQVVCLIVLDAARTGEHGFIDAALIYAMFSFLAAVVLTRILAERRKGK